MISSGIQVELCEVLISLRSRGEDYRGLLQPLYSLFQFTPCFINVLAFIGPSVQLTIHDHGQVPSA